MGSASQLELTILNHQEDVSRFQDELEKFAKQHDIGSHALRQVQLAAEEHLTNIVRHAYGDEAVHEIRIQLRFQSPELQVEITDDGRPFNPLDHPTPDLTLPIDQRPIGGLGIHMMRKSLDNLEYRRQHERNNLLMTKRVG